MSAITDVTSADLPVEPVMEDVLPLRFLKAHQVLPLAEFDDRLEVAMADVTDDYARTAIEIAVERSLIVRQAEPALIQQGLDSLYGDSRRSLAEIAGDDEVETTIAEDAADESEAHLRDLAAEAPVVRLVNRLIQRAIEIRASDIHIEPFEDRLTVRYRIDGILQSAEAPPGRHTAAVISRIKLMAHLNIAERRLPQDGRVQLTIHKRRIDLRVSTVPTLHGESVVLRILDQDGTVMDLESLGFTRIVADRLRHVLTLTHGIVLVTGPTGSGKTTTLYAALHLLNTPERKILTVEDPVEYQLAGINQIQVKPRIDLTFANALRAIVRQDPDVILIGEMRDVETARIGVQSALTGHLVLSTLHTNDAGSAVTRLLDMGLEDYLLTSTINAILAQRLVRKLCQHCKTSFVPEAGVVDEYGLQVTDDGAVPMLYRAVGCQECAQTGYQGRCVVHEVLIMNDALRSQVLANADASQLQKLAVEQGMQTMLNDGLAKAMAGITTLEEVLRVTRDA